METRLKHRQDENDARAKALAEHVKRLKAEQSVHRDHTNFFDPTDTVGLGLLDVGLGGNELPIGIDDLRRARYGLLLRLLAIHGHTIGSIPGDARPKQSRAAVKLKSKKTGECSIGRRQLGAP